MYYAFRRQRYSIAVVSCDAGLRVEIPTRRQAAASRKDFRALTPSVCESYSSAHSILLVLTSIPTLLAVLTLVPLIKSNDIHRHAKYTIKSS